MSSFQQVCPSCKSTLELPVQADGKAAVCPSCQTQFVAAVPQAQAKTSRQALPPRAAKNYRQISIETLLGDTQSIFLGRRRRLLLPFLIPSLLVFVGLVLPVAYFSDLAITNRSLALIWSGALSPWFLLVTSYAIWFALNLSLDVCDAGPQAGSEGSAPTRSRYVPGRRVFISLVVAVAIAMAFAAVLIGVSAAMISVGSKAAAVEIRALIFGGTFAGGLVVATVVAMRLWPVIPLAMSGRFGADTIREAWAMTRPNLMTSFLLVIAISVLVGFGFSVFGIGLLIAVPLAALMLVVALRLIEGTPIPAFESTEF